MQSTPNLSANPRIKSFNGLKVIAVLLIIICHLGLLARFNFCHRMVEVLFVLSGFCMAYNHYMDNSPNTIITGFEIIKQKLPRFYPLHVLTFMLQALFVSTWSQKSLEYLCSVGLLNLTLQQAWFSALQFSYNNVSWFLSALIFCYFITPCLRELGHVSQARHRLLTLFLGVICIRFYMEYMRENHSRQIWYDLHANPLIQGLNYTLGYISGIVYISSNKINSLLKEKLSSPETTLLEVLFIGLYLTCCYTLKDDMYRVFFVILSILPIYILALDKGIISHLLSGKILTFLSTITLEIFMFHSFILYHYPHQYGNTIYYLTFGTLVLSTSALYHIIWKKIYLQIKQKDKKSCYSHQ